jgi:hypothetical protein
MQTPVLRLVAYEAMSSGSVFMLFLPAKQTNDVGFIKEGVFLVN